MATENIDRVLAQADGLIVAAMNEDALAGMAVGIVHDGALVYARGFGLADAKEATQVTPDTGFRIGSISKTFTAIGLMQLWEQGRFQLDAPVNDYLRAYKLRHRDAKAPPVTFRHLLTHTAGIGEFRHVSDLARFRSTFGLGAKEGQPVRPLREYYGGVLATEVYPGEKWAYANHGFATLGQLVEDISGEPFEDYMATHVFAPLGMFHTDYLLSERVRDRLARGYQLKKGGLVPVEYLEVVVRAAGSIFSSVSDMAKYVAALMNGGRNEHGAVLQPETLSMMMQPHYQADPRLPGMGLAFWLDSFDGHHVAWHDGGWSGFTSAMYVAPEDRLGVVAFTNTTSLFGGPDPLARKLLRALLDVGPGADVPQPGLLETPHLWAELCGYYGPKPGFMTNVRVWLAVTGEADVFVKKNRLTMRAIAGPLRKGMTLYRTDPADPLVFQGTFEKMEVPVVFGRNSTGQVDRLSVGGVFSYHTLYKRPLLESLRLKINALIAGLLAAALAWCLRRRGH